MKIKTAEAYLARYRRRGEQRAPKTRDSDYGVHAYACLPEHDHAYKSKPNHQSRALSIREYFLKVWERKTKKTEEVEEPKED